MIIAVEVLFVLHNQRVGSIFASGVLLYMGGDRGVRGARRGGYACRSFFGVSQEGGGVFQERGGGQWGREGVCADVKVNKWTFGGLTWSHICKNKNVVGVNFRAGLSSSWVQKRGPLSELKLTS